MIAHVILFRPKAGLADQARDQLFDAMRAAHAGIPSISRFVAGRRFTTGRPYDALTRDFPFFALVEFADRAAFDAYLAHPLHDALGAQFYMASEAAEAYDFEISAMPGAIDALRPER